MTIARFLFLNIASSFLGKKCVGKRVWRGSVVWITARWMHPGSFFLVIIIFKMMGSSTSSARIALRTLSTSAATIGIVFLIDALLTDRSFSTTAQVIRVGSSWREERTAWTFVSGMILRRIRGRGRGWRRTSWRRASTQSISYWPVYARYVSNITIPINRCV